MTEKKENLNLTFKKVTKILSIPDPKDTYSKKKYKF